MRVLDSRCDFNGNCGAKFCGGYDTISKEAASSADLHYGTFQVSSLRIHTQGKALIYAVSCAGKLNSVSVIKSRIRCFGWLVAAWIDVK